MRYSIFILFIYLTCNTPKLLIVDNCHEKERNPWLKDCIEQYHPENKRELEYYSEHCSQQADNIFCKKDSFIISGSDTTPFIKTNQRIKNKVTNIVR